MKKLLSTLMVIACLALAIPAQAQIKECFQTTSI